MNKMMLKLIEEVRAKNDFIVTITPYGDTRIGMSSMGLRISDYIKSEESE